MTCAQEDPSDIPAGEDFLQTDVARAWAEAASRKRPWRSQFFDRFVCELVDTRAAGLEVLELGSGPGFLAEQVLRRVSSVGSYTLLDFSPAMLSLSQARVNDLAARTRLIQADFKQEDWPVRAGGPFQVVVSMQAVHELRHKRHAPRLYSQVRSVLAEGGTFLVCDHLPGRDPSPERAALYMTEQEQLRTLGAAGFRETAVCYMTNDMALYRARFRS
jgi:ubiquinone/menaquinone biosynthesis C-methylase UbiE